MNNKQLQQILDSNFLEEDFAEVRERVQKAMDASPELVSYEQALKQVKKFLVDVSEPDTFSLD